MNFASYEFWKLLILCFIGSRLILATANKFFPYAEQNTAKLCLLATALILMGSESWLTLSAFLWVVLLGWLTLLLQPAAFVGPLDALTLALILGIAFIALLAEGLGIRKNREPYHFGRARIVSALLIFLIVFLAPMEESRFIYFNF